MKQKKFANSF